MDKTEHIIKSHQYHIALDKQEDAHAVQSTISVLQETRINRLLNDILSEYSDKDSVYQFDRIELDIGIISKTNYENELVFRLEEELIKYFSLNIREDGTLRNGKIIVLNDHKLEQFEHFVLRGYLKWDSLKSQSPSKLLKSLIAENPSGLVSMLTKYWKTESVRKRVIFQFDEEHLEGITYATAKTDSKYIVLYKRNILEHQKKNRLIDTEFSSFRNAIWEIILTYLFVESNSYYTKKSFLQYLINSIAVKYNVTYNLLLDIIAKGVASEKHTSDQLEFRKIIKELKADQQKKETAGKLNPIVKKISSSELMEYLDYYLKTGTFKPEFQIVSKEEFNLQLVNTIQSGNQTFFNKITEWLSDSGKKHGLLAIVNDNTLNLLLKSLDIQTIKENVAFFEVIEKNKIYLSANTRTIFNYIREKKARLILSAFVNNCTQEKALSCLLKEIKNEFYDQTRTLFQLFEEIQIKLPAKFRHCIKQFLGTFSTIHELSMADDEVWKTITEEIREFSGKNKTELWYSRINKHLYKWIKITGLDKQQFIKQLKYKLAINFSDPYVISVLEAVVDTDESKESKIWENIINEIKAYTDENEVELWNQWIENKFSGWVRMTNLTNYDFLNQLKERSVNRNISPGVASLIKKKIEAGITLNTGNSANIYSGPDTLNIINQNSLSVYNSGMLTQAENICRNTVVMEFLEKEISEITLKVKLFSEWSREVSQLLLKISEKYRVELRSVLESLILYFGQNVEGSGYGDLLVKLQSSRYFTILSDKTKTKHKTLYRNDMCVYVLEKGCLPWWSDNYSWDDFNMDFARLWNSPIKKNKIIEIFKLNKQGIHFHKILNKDNLYKVWETLDKSHGKVYSFLMQEVTQLLKNRLLPVGIITVQQYNQITEQYFSVLQKQFSYQSVESLLFQLIEQLIEFTDILKNKSTAQLFTDVLKQIEIKANDSALKGRLNKLVSECLKVSNSEKSGLSSVSAVRKFIPDHSEIKSENIPFIDNPEDIINFSTEEIKHILGDSELRESLADGLTGKDFVKLINFNLNAKQQRFLTESMAIINCSSYFVSLQDFTVLRKKYFSLVLLKLSAGGFSSWNIENWSQLIMQCMSGVFGGVKSKEIFLKINGKLLSEKDDQYKNGIVLLDHIFKISIEELKPQTTMTTKEERDYKKLGEETKREFLDPVYIKNAGLILLSPFLGMLFGKFNLTGNNGFINDESMVKAVHLLRYAATGEAYKEESELIINKLLCGMPITAPIEQNIELTDTEKETVNSLLVAVTQQWRPLNGTSVDGLRESFIQRDGKLEEEDEQFYLKVEQKAFDMLLDQIPWNITRIKLSWMKKMLFIEWR